VSSGDRIAVPTNGHRPALKDDALDSPHHDASGSADRPAAEAGEPADPADAAATTAMSSITASQVIAGAGVVAALALLLLGRRRGRG
jgi:hypothetical protein